MNFDLNSDIAKLGGAFKQLQTAWNDTAQHWNDATSRKFEETFLHPLSVRVRAAVDASNAMATLLGSACDACDPDQPAE